MKRKFFIAFVIVSIIILGVTVFLQAGQSGHAHKTGITHKPVKNDWSKTALVLIDIQDFYFPPSPQALVEPETASLRAAQLLKAFRDNKWEVIHVRHNAGQFAGIHKNVEPLAGEKVISKDQVNSFRDTELLPYLKGKNIEQLVICGMMTNVCVEGAVRAGADFGFKCIVVSDACTTRDFSYGGRTVKGMDVHASTLAVLSYYARVANVATLLQEM